jgi:hypothetical protein
MKSFGIDIYFLLTGYLIDPALLDGGMAGLVCQPDAQLCT